MPAPTRSFPPPRHRDARVAHAQLEQRVALFADRSGAIASAIVRYSACASPSGAAARAFTRHSSNGSPSSFERRISSAAASNACGRSPRAGAWSGRARGGKQPCRISAATSSKRGGAGDTGTAAGRRGAQPPATSAARRSPAARKAHDGKKVSPSWTGRRNRERASFHGFVQGQAAGAAVQSRSHEAGRPRLSNGAWRRRPGAGPRMPAPAA